MFGDASVWTKNSERPEVTRRAEYSGKFRETMGKHQIGCLHETPEDNWITHKIAEACVVEVKGEVRS